MGAVTPRKLVLAAALLVLAPFTAVASVPRTGAAEVLGLKPTTLEARMKKLGIARP